jgi:hypothetical protein
LFEWVGYLRRENRHTPVQIVAAPDRAAVHFGECSVSI